MIRHKLLWMVMSGLLLFFAGVSGGYSEPREYVADQPGKGIERYGDLLNLSSERDVSKDMGDVEKGNDDTSKDKDETASAIKADAGEDSPPSSSIGDLIRKYQYRLTSGTDSPLPSSDGPDRLSAKYRDAFSPVAEALATIDPATPDVDINTYLKTLVSDASDYRIGPGDILDISVWKDSTLSKVVTVLPDGMISLPLSGDIMAAGKKVHELREELSTRLSHFMPDPVVSISVHQVNSMMIYVIGKVNNPGRFMLNNNINVLQALSMAGGLNPFAKKNKIKIFRESAVLGFKYEEVSKGVNLSQNVALQRGDVIVIP